MRCQICVAAVGVALITTLAEAGPENGAARSLVRNGGFETARGWEVGAGAIVPGGSPGRCLRFQRPGGARQDVLVAGREATLTAAVDVRLDGVRAEEGQSGYAFAAVYQTDETGRLVGFQDFVQLRGTVSWQRHHTTFQVHPQADFVSLRCGLFQATGTACFDNWTLVAGSEPKRLDEVRRPAVPSGPPGGTAAIFCEPGMPITGKASPPETLAAILRKAGFEVRLLSADQLADPMVFNASQFDLVVLPTGESFPAEARPAMIEFLRGGGDFISVGGYAFNRLLRRVNGRWVPEEQAVRAELDRATRAESSLVPNGGFERVQDVPLSGTAVEGQWRRTSGDCTVVEETPSEGRFCAKVAVPATAVNPGGQFQLDLPAKPNAVYQASGWMRTQGVTGQGIAFMAVYQYGGGKLVEHRDFAATRGTTDWRPYRYVFTPKPGVSRLHVKLGLYLARGTAWFDDIRLADITGIGLKPMNTASGTPADGLEVSPAQIGVFDASFPLKRACRLKTAPRQHIVREQVEQEGDLAGWAASGVVGYDNARWIPLIQTYDRYGRPRGAAAAVVLNYNGFYAGSCWACFGVENRDLFEDPDGAAARALAQIARFIRRKMFLRNLTTGRRLYQQGEPVGASVVVDNRGARQRHGQVCFSLSRAGDERPVATATRDVAVESDTNQRVNAAFSKLDADADLYRVTATLEIDGEPIDEMVSGFVIEKPPVVSSGPELRFSDNYFTLNGRPTFLFGSDTYSRTYHSAAENPRTWWDELRAARDMGLNLYENLQYNNPGHRMSDDDWRSFRAMSQLTQGLNLVFMPGMLIGHNVAVGDAALSEESSLCREYARRLGDTPGLLYYVNGDYQMGLDQHPEDVNVLWNRWLKAKHETADRLRSAWGKGAVTGDLGDLEFPPPNSGRWDDAAAVDKLRFQNWLTRRWNRAHVEAVREHDRRHPITSEYYSRPFGGLDLVLTIDGQDVSNIGYFDQPVDDIDNLPLAIRWNDLRARGKGVSLGEYGVKTHPAWSEEKGAGGYHVARTEEEQKQLFVAVAHYGFGMGLSKIQNWCLRDAQARVFPWGIFYPNQLIPKDVAYVHRNLSIIWRHFSPRYVAPPLTVCLANQLRLGNDEALGTAIAYRAFADLLALHYDFNTIDDHHLEQVPSAAKAIVYPAPFALRDEAYAGLLAWVKRGGTLIVTGDFSYDANRQRTRTRRLEELAGVRFLAENYPNVARSLGQETKAEFSLSGMQSYPVRPCIRAEPFSAQVLGWTAEGQPVLFRNAVGRGVVHFFADPIELADDDSARGLRRQLYSALLETAGVEPLAVTPNVPWIHVMAQPTAGGTVHVIYNTKMEEGTAEVQIPTTAGPIHLTTRNRWPALAAVTQDGKVVGLSACGEAAVKQVPLLTGEGLNAVLSLNGEDLRESGAILIAPFEPGHVALPERSGDLTAVVGEFRGGQWTPLERIGLDDVPSLEIDADRATGLTLVCAEGEEDHWAGYLTEAMRHPDRIEGHD